MNTDLFLVALFLDVQVACWPCSFFYVYFYFLLLLLLFFFFFFASRRFYCWVIILNFSSFSIILFAVDLSFPIFVSNMSVVVIFSFLSSMRAGHSSSICSSCSCVSVLLPHALPFGSVFLLW